MAYKRRGTFPDFPAPLPQGNERVVSVTGTRRAYGDQPEYSNGGVGSGPRGTVYSDCPSPGPRGNLGTDQRHTAGSLGLRPKNTNRTGEDRIG